MHIRLIHNKKFGAKKIVPFHSFLPYYIFEKSATSLIFDTLKAMHLFFLVVFNIFLFLFLFFNFYCCSITVVPIFPLCSILSRPPPSVSPHPAVHVHGSFIHIPWLDPSPLFPHYPPPTSSLVPVSLFLFPHLWFYFAHVFVLFIRVHL